MKTLRGWALIAITWIVASLSASPAVAQFVSFYSSGSDSSDSYSSGSTAGAQAGYGPAPTYMTGPGSFGPAYPTVPASYMGPGGMAAPGGGITQAALLSVGQGDGGFEFESDLCDECRSEGHSRGRAHGPFEDCTCGPRWFNVHFEALYLMREEVSRQRDFTSDGVSGTRVLSTNDLDFDYELGFRATGRIDVGAASNIEASFLGGFEWNTNAQVTNGSDNLYSVLSSYGVSPAGGFVDTDQASVHAIDYSTQLNSGEVSWRHHWVSPNLRIQGSWLLGARYTNLEETFVLSTIALLHNDPLVGGNPLRGPGSMNYRTETRNNLIGFQTGGDAYMCLVPGLTLGSEVKAGIYGNRATHDTIVSATSLGSTVREEASSNEIALVAEGGIMAVYQISPGFSLRAGYQIVYLDGVALAPENFNTGSPFGGPRTATINSNGSALYHGGTAGFEWMW